MFCSILVSLGWGETDAAVLLSVVAGEEDEVVVVEAVDFQADVGEGPEAEGLLDEDGVGGYGVLGETLDVEAVAAVLEIAIDLGLVEVLDPDDGP